MLKYKKITFANFSSFLTFIPGGEVTVCCPDSGGADR